MGESVPKVASATYPQPEAGDQPAHIDGLPLGTRGGMRFRHNFPADGEYRFTIPDVGVDLYTRAVETRHTLIILVDGREVFRASVGGADDLRIVDRDGAPGRAEIMKRFANIPVQVKAGIHDVAVTFIERARVESDEFVGFLPGDAFSRGDREPRLVGGVQVMGPFNSPGVSDDREPAADLHLPAGQEPGKGLCPPHRRQPGAPRVPSSGHATAISIRSMPYFDSGADCRAEAQARRSMRGSSRSSLRCWSAPSFSSERSGRRPARRTAKRSR